MDLSLFFAGTGGSAPAAGRGLPAVLVRRGGDRLLFDCGEGTQRQLLRSVGLVDMDSVFITHFHADHWLGLPGMLKSLALRDRQAPLAVYGPRGLSELMGVMRIVYGRLPFELSVTELDPAQAVERDGYRIAAVPVAHGERVAYGYALVEDQRPGEFDPERFTPERVAARPKYAYFPFIGGPHQCIGNEFALLEMQIVLAMVTQRFCLEMLPGQTVKPRASLGLRPAGPIAMAVRRRATPQTAGEGARGPS